MLGRPRKQTVQSRRKEPTAPKKDEAPSRGTHKKVVAWAGGLITATVVAAGVAFGTGFGQWLFHKASESPPARSGPPVRVDSVTLIEPTGTYALPQRLVLNPADLRSLNHLLPSDPGYDTWFRSRGGVDTGQSVVKLVLEGNRPDPVYIIDMGVLEHCAPPLNGTLFFNAPLGGTVNDLGISFNLDLPRPFPQNGLITGSYFAAHTVSLKQRETGILEVVSSSARYCEYRFTLTVVDGAATLKEVVTNHGQPFRVTGLLQGGSHYGALYVGGVSPGQSAPFRRRNPVTSKY